MWKSHEIPWFPEEDELHFWWVFRIFFVCSQEDTVEIPCDPRDAHVEWAPVGPVKPLDPWDTPWFWARNLGMSVVRPPIGIRALHVYSTPIKGSLEESWKSRFLYRNMCIARTRQVPEISSSQECDKFCLYACEWSLTFSQLCSVNSSSSCFSPFQLWPPLLSSSQLLSGLSSFQFFSQLVSAVLNDSHLCIPLRTSSQPVSTALNLSQLNSFDLFPPLLNSSRHFSPLLNSCR